MLLRPTWEEMSPTPPTWCPPWQSTQVGLAAAALATACGLAASPRPETVLSSASRRWQRPQSTLCIGCPWGVASISRWQSTQVKELCADPCSVEASTRGAFSA